MRVVVFDVCIKQEVEEISRTPIILICDRLYMCSVTCSLYTLVLAVQFTGKTKVPTLSCVQDRSPLEDDPKFIQGNATILIISINNVFLICFRWVSPGLCVYYM